MSMEKLLVGVDLGGTTIKIAFVTIDGEIQTKWEIPTDISNDGQNITKDIAKAIIGQLNLQQIKKDQLIGIGMGAPGFINMETGFIYQAVNIGWRNYPLKDELEKATGLPVIVDNDANIAALGEMWKGAGGGAKDLICVTLGTGVGGGIVANGQILHGTNGMAGEIGHITVIPDGGAPCNCGKTGCLETIASATGIARIAREKAELNRESLLYKILQTEGQITSKAVFDSARDGDDVVADIIDEVMQSLGLALANMANTLNPEKIIIGGGVSKAGEQLLDPLVRHFRKYTLPRVSEGVDLAIATLGNDAGVIGGAWLVKNNHHN